MFADIGNIVGLLIFAVIAVVSALLKKKEKAEEETFELPPELKPRRDRPTPPPSRSWEEELRHLLEDRPVPPPIVQHIPPPAPRIPTPPRPVVAQQWEEGHGESDLSLPHPHLGGTFQPIPGLRESQERYGHASHLQERVAEHMGESLRHRVGTTSVHRALATIEAVDVAQMVRTRRGLRTAMIASIILGPPRALEG